MALERSTGLAPSLRYALYASGLALVASGAAWLYVRYGVPAEVRPREALTWSMRLHGAAAMIALVLIGCAVALHVKTAWREDRNRASGLFLGSALGVLVLTAYVLYYAGGEALRGAASSVHWIIGLGLPVVLACHVAGRRRRHCAEGTAGPVTNGNEARR